MSVLFICESIFGFIFLLCTEQNLTELRSQKRTFLYI